MSHALLRALFGAAIVLLLYGPARAETQAGKVIAVAGEAFVEAGGQKTALKLGAAVNVGDVVTTADTGKLRIRMNDGSIVSIASGSNLTVNTLTLDASGKRENAELALGQGLIRAVVAPVNHPTTFEVKTATGTAAVRSTDWFVRVKDDTTETAVLTGSVTLMSSSTGVKVTLPQRNGASVAAGRDPTDPKPWTQAQFNAVIAATTIAAARAPRRSNDENQDQGGQYQNNPYQGNPYQGNPYQGGPGPDQGGPPPDAGNYAPPIGTQTPPFTGFGGSFGQPSGGNFNPGGTGGFNNPRGGNTGGTTGVPTGAPSGGTTGGSPTGSPPANSPFSPGTTAPPGRRGG